MFLYAMDGCSDSETVGDCCLQGVTAKDSIGVEGAIKSLDF